MISVKDMVTGGTCANCLCKNNTTPFPLLTLAVYSQAK